MIQLIFIFCCWMVVLFSTQEEMKAVVNSGKYKINESNSKYMESNEQEYIKEKHLTVTTQWFKETDSNTVSMLIRRTKIQ